MIWVFAAGLVLSMIFVAFGVAAFTRERPAPRPSWMTEDVDTGERPYVGRRRRAKDKDAVGTEGTGDCPLAEDLPWSILRGEQPRAGCLEERPTQPLSHPRTLENVDQDRTQVIRPLNPPPEWPPRRPVE